MAGEHCSDCRFFVNHEYMGVCRRYPTHVNRSKNEWCGEFSLAKQTLTPVNPGGFLPIVGETSENLDILKPRRGRPPKDKE